ncbi:hypothetical protein BKA70DRAFT_57707 [Coprinopsis sp. MPI-PUGE-AT-0042]|nr:hypothetical protein BKA70DRAFT_57707 [Coprinopsis sp. MPI-PUGE-AT-0042]
MEGSSAVPSHPANIIGVLSTPDPFLPTQMPDVETRASLALGDTYGVALVGVFVNAVLYGVTVSQTYIFYSKYPNDGRGKKFIVGWLWVLDTAHTCLACLSMYHYLITNYANPVVLLRCHWSILISVLVNRLIGVIAQGYFTFMAFKLYPPRFKWCLGLTTDFFVIVHGLYGTAFVVLCFIWDGDYARIREANIYAATPAVAVGVVAEILIAGSLCILLHGKETGFEGTKRLIKIIIIYAINRCLLTSSFLTLEVVLIETTPKAFYYIAIELIVGKLYVTSVLSTLISRPQEQPAAQTSRVIMSHRTTDSVR